MRWNQLSWLLPGNYAYWIMIIIIVCIIGLNWMVSILCWIATMFAYVGTQITMPQRDWDREREGMFIAWFDNIVINIPSSNECLCACLYLSMANRDSYDMTRFCWLHRDREREREMGMIERMFACRPCLSFMRIHSKKRIRFENYRVSNNRLRQHTHRFLLLYAYNFKHGKNLYSQS